MVVAVFNASCHVLVRTAPGPMPALREGAQPNLFFNGGFAVCRIEKIDHGPIEQGQTGDIRVRAILEDKARKTLVPGAEFEFRHGPSKQWAVCHVTAVLEIQDEPIGQ